MSFKPSEVDMFLKSKLAGVEGGDDVFESDEYKRLCELLCYMPETLARDIISGAIIYSELAIKNVGEVTKNDIIKLISSKNKTTFVSYAKAVASIDGMDIDDNAKAVLLRQIFSSIEPVTHDADTNVVSIAGEFVEQAEKVSSTFSSLAGPEKSALVSKIYQNCIGRMKNFWQRVEPEKFKGVVETLSNELPDGNLSEDELIELSSRCATIFCESSREKILGIEKILNEYKEFVLEQIKDDQSVDKRVIQALEDLKYSSILKKAGSIAKYLPEQVEKVSKFLRGQSIAEIFGKDTEENQKNANLYTEFGSAKLNLSVEDMIWVMLKNPSIFGASIDSALMCVKNVKDAMHASYGENAKGIDYSSLLSRENFLKGMPSVDSFDEISRTVELLSSFIPAGELAKYLQKDMMILDVPFEDIRDTVRNVLKTSSIEDAGKQLSEMLKNGTFKKSVVSQKKEKAAKTANNNIVRGEQNSRVSVPLSFDEIDDVMIEFDISKLKLILGDDFEAWAKKYETSNIDKKKLSSVIERTKGNSVLAEIASEKKPNAILIDGDQFQQFMHEKEHTDVNVIEMLWQLQRNIDAATALVGKFSSNPEKYKHRDVVFIASTNYFKVATERDETLDLLHDRIPIEIYEAVDYAQRLVDESFEVLTHDFTAFVKKDSRYLNTYIAELEDQREDILKAIESNSFLSFGEGENLQETKVQLQRELEKQRISYDELLQARELLRIRKKQKERELKLEMDNPTTVQSGEHGDKYSFDYVLDENATENEIMADLSKMDVEVDKNNATLAMILNKIRRLEFEIDELSRHERSDQIIASKREKLQKLLSRLEHAKRIKESVDSGQGDESLEK